MEGSYISWTLTFYPVSLPRISQFIFRTSEFVFRRLPQFITRHSEFIFPRLPEFISGPCRGGILHLWILTCVRTTAGVSYISWILTFYPVSLPRISQFIFRTPEFIFPRFPEFIFPRFPEFIFLRLLEFISGSMQREHFVLVDPDLRQDDGRGELHPDQRQEYRFGELNDVMSCNRYLFVFDYTGYS
ncbi:hypothetical protein [Pseudoalteromonas sp. MMG005]|uniref:hypothetical protein n=1 Tax=Pseudoalteromonas sp. MMG005 TaxID=2822682 RepID=UPI001B3A193E|nr:hypothetical protein [Pseudoalteromonas sp. MMG005]MBQ4846778.1 hypothetical protein [Pseudoalteromonas sp. MMG005]